MAKIKLTSFGAAEEVTGSCHLLEIDDYKLLIDCGLFQGDFDNYLKNWDPWPFDPRSIQAVILTHAHLDHCGRLPKLLAHGYRGPIYATPPTIQLSQIVLADSQAILEEKSFRHYLPPLYAPNDLQKVQRSFQSMNYYQEIILGSKIKFTLHNAGHILGGSLVEIKVAGQTIVFSGDLGGEDMPLVKNVDYLKKADYVIMEGTYGDRQHEQQNRAQQLLAAVNRVTLNNSTLLIAIFAVERSQDVLKVLNDYYESHLDFRVPVFFDCPLAARATKIYQEHLDYLNPAAQATLLKDHDIFSFPHLQITNNVNQSKK